MFDKFNVSEFYIQSDTFIQAGTSDTEGWITNPATADTDYDGWNDYYEIFTSSTNPICADTDGDGVWDKHDRDPKRDVMLKISPISGAAEGKYKLVIVTAFSLSGTGDDCYIPTPKVYAHEYESSLWTAYFDGTHGSSTELHYYANIDDDTRIQSNNLDFTIQLWRFDRYYYVLGVKCKKWDKKLVGGIDTYHINNIGHSETLNATKYDDSQEVKYEAKVKVETIGVEKANTIAIYKTNGTVFNGHYQEQERMNVIQLYVNDTGSGTPFEEGLNTIVIPTSLFTETIFNARVQNETLNETAIYSDDEDVFKFISVGRDGNTEQASEEIDFIIIRFDISSEDAMGVLNLLLECLVNETLNETAIIYNYVSTKENGTAAVMMNLPFSVLGLIPWYCNFENSPMGSKPETFEDWFWKPLKTIGMAMVGVIITIGMAIVDLVMLIIDFVVEILLDILPILAYILWLIIRVLIYIFLLIIFVLSLVLVVILFASIVSIIIPLSVFIDISIELSLNNITITGKLELLLEYNISMVESKFLGFSVPAINLYINSSNFEFKYSSYFFGENFEICRFSENIYGNFTDDEPEQSSGYFPKTSDLSQEKINGYDFITGVGVSMGMMGGIVGTFAGILSITHEEKAKFAIFIIGFLSFVISMTLFILFILDSPETFSSATLRGMALGFFISGLVFIMTGTYIFKKWNYMAFFADIFGTVALFDLIAVIDTIGGWLGLFFDLETHLGFLDYIDDDTYNKAVSRSSMIFGAFSLFLAIQALIELGGKDEMGFNYLGFDRLWKTGFSLLFAGSSILLAIWCFNLSQ